MNAIGVHTDKQITKSKALELLAVEGLCMSGEEHSCVSGIVLFPSHTVLGSLLPPSPSQQMVEYPQQENGAQGPLMSGISGAPIPGSGAVSL